MNVSSEGISVGKDIIEVVESWPKATNITELRSFLFLLQFFRRFIKNFSKIASLLKHLTLKDKGISVWDENCSKAFHLLKKCFISAPILIAPDWSKSFRCHTDASQYAML